MNEKDNTKREKVAEIVQCKRVQTGWTQQQLADEVGVSWSTIQRYEAGKFNLNADLVYKIFDVLNIEFKLDDEKI